jgi:gluconate kinase
MPPGLLRSQFDSLQEPSAEERAIAVSIDAAPEEIAARVLERLG